MTRTVTPDAEVEALAARAAAGEALSPAEAARLCAGDVLVLGAAANDLRRRLHGERATLVRVRLRTWTAAENDTPVAGEMPDEVRIEGSLPDGATLGDVRATVARARESAPGAAVRAVRPAELLALAAAAALPPRTAVSRLADAGLATLAHPAPGDDPEATREGLLAAHGAGLATDAPVVYGSRIPPEYLAQILLRLRDVPGAAAAFRCVVPIPDSLPEQSPLTGTTGIEDLRVFACARLLLPSIPRVAAESALHGPKLAAVALDLGADTLAGALEAPTARLTPADAEKPRPFNADRARRLLAEAGREPVAPPPFPRREA